MTDFLGASASRANAITGASLQDIRAANDPATPLLGGMRVGMGMAAQMQELQTRALDEEARRIEYADRLTQKQAELALRQTMAQTNQMEAQAAIMRADAEKIRLQQAKEMNGPQQRQGEIILRHMLENPVHFDEKGKAVLTLPDASGKLVVTKDLDPNDPRVAPYLRQRQLDEEYTAARRDAAQARAMEDMADAENRANPRPTNRMVGAETLRAMLAEQRDIVNSRRASEEAKKAAQAEIDRIKPKLDALIDSIDAPLPSAKPAAAPPAAGAVDEEAAASPFAPLIERGSRAIGFALNDPIMTTGLRNTAARIGMDQAQLMRAIQATVGVELADDPSADPVATMREIFQILNGDDDEEREALLEDLRRVR